MWTNRLLQFRRIPSPDASCGIRSPTPSLVAEGEQSAICALWIIVLLVATGCGPSRPERVRVSGDVTLDGQPVQDGEIIFTHIDQRLGAEAGRIVAGRFELMAKPGQQRVEINASREVPGTEGQGFRGGRLLEDYIPERYNTATILSAEVTRDRGQHFEFELLTTPPPPGPPDEQ